MQGCQSCNIASSFHVESVYIFRKVGDLDATVLDTENTWVQDPCVEVASCWKQHLRVNRALYSRVRVHASPLVSYLPCVASCYCILSVKEPPRATFGYQSQTSLLMKGKALRKEQLDLESPENFLSIHSSAEYSRSKLGFQNNTTVDSSMISLFLFLFIVFILHSKPEIAQFHQQLF